MPKKKRRPSLKAKKLAQLVAAGYPQQQAAIVAGYSPKNPSQSASQVLRSLRSSFPDLMDRLGLTDSCLVNDHLKPLLKAKRTKHFAHNGRVISSRSYRDNDTRLAALDMAFRLKGSYAAIKTETETKHIDSIIIDLPRPKRLLPEDDNEAVTGEPKMVEAGEAEEG